MEEDAYKETYGDLTQVPCVYEKALTNQRASCQFARHFCLADREGYACQSAGYSEQCRYFLEKLRENSRFALKTHEVAGALPHNMELKVQVGGLLGLTGLLSDRSDIAISGDDLHARIEDIHSLLETVLQQYDGVEQIPYNRIVPSITRFKARQRRKR